MIPARKHAWFDRWFASQARGRLGATFARVRLAGAEHLREASAAGPVLLVSNHCAWWDPLVVLYLETYVFRGDWYAMMDAANLRRLPFFGLVGAFGVDLDVASDGAAAMKYSARLLKRPGQAVWIFPQGAERPQSLRPLGFRAGSAEIARIARVKTVPVALRYAFVHEARPELLVDLGPAMEFGRDVTLGRAQHEAAVTEGLDRIEADLLAERFDRYTTVLDVPEGPIGRLAERVLAWMTRPRGRAALPPPRTTD